MSPLRAYLLKSAMTKSAFDRAGDVARELDPAGRSPGVMEEFSKLKDAVVDKRILDVPGAVSDVALAGQKALSKSTGTNLPLIASGEAVAKARRRQKIWRNAFAQQKVPFSEHYLSAGGDFSSPEIVRAAFVAAGKPIDEARALSLSVRMTQMLDEEEQSILDRDWSKAASLVGLDKMRSILQSARKIRGSIGADAADRFTMEHLGSVYSVANRRLRNQARQLGAHTPGTVRDSSPSLVAEPAQGPLQQVLMPFMNKQASFASRLRIARNKTHTHPTPAQAHAGNYAKGSLLLHGMHIKLENPKGTERRGYDKDGNVTWKRVMAADYGYFANSKAIDGDAVDVFIGDDLDSNFVAAVDQTKSDGSFDETKFVLGTTSQEQAEKLYLAHYPRGWKLGPVSTTTVQQLKEWLRNGNTKSPFKGQMVKAAVTAEDTSTSQTLTTLLSSLGGVLGGFVTGTAIGSQASGKQLAAMQKVNLRDQRLGTKYDALLNATHGSGGRNRDAELLVHAGPVMQKLKRLRGKNSKLFGNLVDVVRSREVIGGRVGGTAGLALGAAAPFAISELRRHFAGDTKAPIEKAAVVKQDDDTGKWILWTRDKKRKLGAHDTPEEAYGQEYAIQKSQERAAPKPGTAANFHKKLKAALGQTEKAASVADVAQRLAPYRVAFKELLVGSKLPPLPASLKNVPSNADDLSQLLPRVRSLLNYTFSGTTRHP